MSTNPWKITATFQTISSTREEYLIVIEELKKKAPGPLKKGEKRSRLDQAHLSVIESLENRIGAIDAEIAVSYFLNVSLLLCIARGIWSGGVLAVLCLDANCVFVASCSFEMSSVCNESNGRQNSEERCWRKPSYARREPDVEHTGPITFIATNLKVRQVPNSVDILGSALSRLKIRMTEMTIIMKRTKTMCLTMMIS